MIATALAEMFEPRYSRRYIGRHRAGRPRYVGTAVVPDTIVAASPHHETGPAETGPTGTGPTGAGPTETGPAEVGAAEVGPDREEPAGAGAALEPAD